MKYIKYNSITWVLLALGLTNISLPIAASQNTSVTKEERDDPAVDTLSQHQSRITPIALNELYLSAREAEQTATQKYLVTLANNKMLTDIERKLDLGMASSEDVHNARQDYKDSFDMYKIAMQSCLDLSAKVKAMCQQSQEQETLELAAQLNVICQELPDTFPVN